MNSTNRLLLVSCLSLAACSNAEYPMPFLSEVAIYSVDLEGSVCQSGKNFVTEDGSHISWCAMKVTPAEVYKLNLRSLSPVVNGINLIDSDQRLIDLVPGVKMEDDVTINFNLEFKPTCL